MIKAIIFDWVGPLLEVDPCQKPDVAVEIAEKLWQEFKDDAKVIAGLKENELTKNMPLDDILNRVVNKYRKIDYVWKHILPRLKKKYKLGIINNGMGITIPIFKAKFQPDEFFEIFINSAIEGVSKPNPAIYLFACNRLNVQPAECVFIDDSERYVKGAQSVGMQGIVFLGTEELVQQLKNIGMLSD